MFKEKKLVVASHNSGKLVEIQDLLKDLDIEILSAKGFNLDEPVETGKTFIENAILKAEYVFKKTNLPTLADDSGLCVNALNGEPGIYSARWAGENKDFNWAMNKVNDKLCSLGNLDRTAYFICVMALIVPSHEPIVFEGKVEGQLVWPVKGSNGFGFDPMFVPKGYDKTFGELDSNIKQKISHRANALLKMKKFLE